MRRLFNPKERLGEYFSHILEGFIDNKRTNALFQSDSSESDDRDILSLFNDFYQEMNGQPISQAEQEILMEVIDAVSGRLK